MAGINLSKIEKTYLVDEQPLSVLNGIDLEIPEQCITVILGRSGCGKTTLLRIVGGLEQADSGELTWEENHKTAYVFQEPRLMPWLNVWNNVKFGLKKEEQDDKQIQDIIDMVGLHGFENAHPDQLSGGMQQRTAIARALAYKPSFIMMDEPFASLDFFTRSQMQKELMKLQQEQGTSILFVTHSIDEALLLGHKIAVIEEGRVKAEFAVDISHRERNLLEPEFIELKKRILEQLDM